MLCSVCQSCLVMITLLSIATGMATQDDAMEMQWYRAVCLETGTATAGFTFEGNLPMTSSLRNAVKDRTKKTKRNIVSINNSLGTKKVNSCPSMSTVTVAHNVSLDLNSEQNEVRDLLVEHNSGLLLLSKAISAETRVGMRKKLVSLDKAARPLTCALFLYLKHLNASTISSLPPVGHTALGATNDYKSTAKLLRQLCNVLSHTEHLIARWPDTGKADLTTVFAVITVAFSLLLLTTFAVVKACYRPCSKRCAARNGVESAEDGAVQIELINVQHRQENNEPADAPPAIIRNVDETDNVEL